MSTPTRVVVTRPAGQAEGLADLLGAAGFEAVRLPLITVRDHIGPDRDAGLVALPSADVVVVTSANGASRLCTLVADGVPLRADVTVVAVGDPTRVALERGGLAVDLVPATATGAAVAEMLAGRGVAGRRVVLARALDGRPELPVALLVAGAEVIELPLYASVDITPPEDDLTRARGAEVWTLTSPRIVDGAVRAVGHEALGRAALVSIGPTTSAHIREIGLQVAGEATDASTDAIVEQVAAVTSRAVWRPPPAGR